MPDLQWRQMMAYYYLKLHHEMLHDPKMGMLSDHLYRRVIELFLIASERPERDGYLPDLDVMAWTLHVGPESLEADLEEIEDTGIVQLVNGRWYVTNFVKRQASDDPTAVDRMRRYRERNSPVTDSVTDNQDNNDVTRNVTRNNPEMLRVELRVKNIEENIEENIDREKETPAAVVSNPFDNMRQMIETVTGLPITPTQSEIDAINAMIKADITDADLRDAIAFFRDQGKTARGAASLLRSAQVAHAKRIQATTARASPGGNGKKANEVKLTVCPNCSRVYPGDKCPNCEAESEIMV